MLPYKQIKSPIKKFKEEENETGKLYLVLKMLSGAKKDKDWSGVDEAISTMGDMLDSLKESKKKSFREGKIASLEEIVNLFKKGWKATPRILDKTSELIEVPTGHELPIKLMIIDDKIK